MTLLMMEVLRVRKSVKSLTICISTMKLSNVFFLLDDLRIRKFRGQIVKIPIQHQRTRPYKISEDVIRMRFFRSDMSGKRKARSYEDIEAMTGYSIRSMKRVVGRTVRMVAVNLGEKIR